MSTIYHSPIAAGASTAAAVEGSLAQLDQAIVDRQTNISTETSRATGAEGALAGRATALEGEVTAARDGQSTLQNRIRTVENARIAADLIEANARTAADWSELLLRLAGDSGLQAQLDRLVAVASTSGGTASTVLTRPAFALVITSIGGNGTLTTVTTSGAHGLTAGDQLQNAGTTNYNGATGPISILSANQFTYASAVNAATETTGTAAHVALTVASIASFVAGQRISVTNDQGQLHTTTVSGTPSGSTITLAAAVPTSWTGSAKASTGAWVSTTLEEIALARTKIPSGNGYLIKGLPDTIDKIGGQLHNLRAFGAVADGTTDCAPALAAAAAAISAAGRGKLFVPAGQYALTSQALISMTNFVIIGEHGAEFIVPASATVPRPFVLRNCADGVVAGLRFTRVNGATILPTVAIALENSSRVTIERNRISGYGTYGIVVSQATTPTVTGTDVSFDSGTKTITKTAGVSGIAPGATIVIQGTNSNNTIRTVASVGANTIVTNEALTTEAAGANVSIQLATACDDITIVHNLIEDAGVIGVEAFPKVLSRNITVAFNTIRRCNILNGSPVSGGAGIKAGSMYRNSIIAYNHLEDCGTAIAAGMWDTQYIHHNVIVNPVRYGIALSMSQHRLFSGTSGAPFTSIVVEANQLIHTLDFLATNPVAYAALNFNGLVTTGGPVEWANNVVVNWAGPAWAVDKSLVKTPRLLVGRNRFLESGGAAVNPLTSTATTSTGSAVLTNVNTGGNLPAGWTIGTAVNGTGIQAGSLVQSIAYTGASLTVSQNATTSNSVTLRNTDDSLEVTGTLTSGTNVINVASIDGWNVGDPIVAPGLPSGTVVTNGTPGSATFTLTKTATANGTITITSDLPAVLEVTGNRFVYTPATITADISGTTLSNISTADMAKLSIGMYVTGAGIPGSTTITALPTSSTATISNSSSSGTGVTITASKIRKANLWGNNIRVIENVFDGYGDYGIDVQGGGLILRNTFMNMTPQNIANRGAIFIRDAAAYTVAGNLLDNAVTGTAAYMINADGTTQLREHDNYTTSGAVPVVKTATSGFGALTQTLFSSHAGRREFWASAAPSVSGDGTYAIGAICWNTAPAEAGSAASKYTTLGWVCTVAGSPGTWLPLRALTGN